MQRDQSIYLDALRFLLAATVFVGHASGEKYTGGLGWQLQPYGQTAVIGFFVLSGFVIAHATRTKNYDFSRFAIDRISRLSSVALPSVLLTLGCTYLSISIADNSAGGPHRGAFLSELPSNEHVRFFLTSVFLNNVWQIKLNPSLNEPFWSLPFEFFYYLAFGIFFFSRRRSRYLLVVMCLLFAGPSITLLFPVWIAGYLSYHYRHVTRIVPRSFAALVSLLALGLCLTAHLWIDIPLGGDETLLRQRILLDYVEGAMFAIHLLFSGALASYDRGLLNWFAHTIRQLGALTFPLYLMHRPLIEILPQLTGLSPDSTINRIAVYLGVLVFVFTATPFTDRIRISIRSSLYRLHTRG